MLRLYACPITPEDAHHLVATLLADGTPDAISGAAMIAKGVDCQLYAIAFTAGERNAVLGRARDSPRHARRAPRGGRTRTHRDRM